MPTTALCASTRQALLAGRNHHRSLSMPFVDQVDEKAYTRDFEQVISRMMYAGSSVGFGQTVTMSLELLRSHGLRLGPNLTVAVKDWMPADAFFNLLYPEGGLVQEGTQMGRKMALDEVRLLRLSMWSRNRRC
jgi:hypothetical protein